MSEHQFQSIYRLGYGDAMAESGRRKSWPKTALLLLVVAILASSPYAVLFGFALVGAGVAPVIPVVMSRAGSCPGVDPGAACSAVSTVGYGTLLVIPPVIGTMADAVGFSAAFLMWPEVKDIMGQLGRH